MKLFECGAFFGLFVFIVNFTQHIATTSIITCANTASAITHFTEDGELKKSVTELPFQECHNNYCHTLWQRHESNDSITILSQGCWDISGEPNECDQDKCETSERPPKAMNNTKFCCCSSNLCNVNFTDSYMSNGTVLNNTMHQTWENVGLMPPWLVPIVYLAGLVSAIILSFALLLWGHKCGCGPVIRRILDKRENKICKADHLPCDEFAARLLVELNLEHLQLDQIIGEGRFGCVWRATLDGQPVAAKVFESRHRQHFFSEYEIFRMAGCNSALVKCYGGGKYAGNDDSDPEHVLLLNLETECLQDYLRKYTLDFLTLSKMCQSVAKGVAYLHSDLGKVPIVHRDLNTRNILVKPDLTCCLCDMGLAVCPRLVGNKAISEAGTPRYMAPEVLEGAVNLRDVEGALKQIDVYALGLVLWEIGIRCVDLQITEPAPYSPPFNVLQHSNPTLDFMQSLVIRDKLRPEWPNSWKTTAVAQTFRETAEDCWDHDAEARLTALCVVERLSDLPLLINCNTRILYYGDSDTVTHKIHSEWMMQFGDCSVGTIETLLSPSVHDSESTTCSKRDFSSTTTRFRSYSPQLEHTPLANSCDHLLADTDYDCRASFQNDVPRVSGQKKKHSLLQQNDNITEVKSRRFMPFIQNVLNYSGSGCRAKKHKRSAASTSSKRLHRKWMHNMRPLLRKVLLDNETAYKSLPVMIAKMPLNKNHNLNSKPFVSNQKRPNTLHFTLKCNSEPGGNNVDRTRLVLSKSEQEHSNWEHHFESMFRSTGALNMKHPSQRIKTPGDVPASVRRPRSTALNSCLPIIRFSLYDDRIMSGGWKSSPELMLGHAKGSPDNCLPTLVCSTHECNDKDSICSF